MSTRENLLAGSNNGPVLSPNEPNDSFLLTTLTEDSDSHMPPKKQLSEDQISILTKWIDQGSHWDQETLSRISPIDLAEWKLHPLPDDYIPVLAMTSCESNGAMLSSQGKDLIVTHLEDKKPIQVKLPTRHRDAVRSLTVTPDQTNWVSGGFGIIHFWDVKTGQVERSISEPLEGRITSLQYTMDGSRLLVGESLPGVFGKIHVFPSDQFAPSHSWLAHDDEITDLQESGNGSYWMTASADHTVRTWETDTLREANWLEGHTAPVTNLTQNTDSTLLISAGLDNAIKVWDQQSGERLYDLGRHQFGILNLIWMAERSELYALNQKGTLYRYQDLKPHTGAQSSNTGRERVIQRTKKPGSCLIYWKKHNCLVMGTFEGELQSFTMDGKSLWTTKPFSPKSKSLASD